VRFRLLCVALVAAVAGFPVAPPVHAHETADHGRQHLLVHRHAQAHTHATAAHHHDGTFDDGDEAPIRIVDDVYASPGKTTDVAEPAASAAVLPSPALSPRSAVTEYVGGLIHGPPRGPTSLRAPPAFPAR
jgi:hypothetical protein